MSLDMIDFEKSCKDLKTAYSSSETYAPSLFVSERKLRWNKFTIKRFTFVPDKKKSTMWVGGPTHKLIQIDYVEPLTHTFVVREDFDPITSDNYTNAVISPISIGPALSAILTFALECLVLTYPDSTPIVTWFEDELKINNDWPSTIESFYYRRIGLQESSDNFPMPEEEEFFLNRLDQILNKLLHYDDNEYMKIMRALRFYQYALYNSRIDLNLTYSLLVQVVDIISDKYKKRLRMKDFDPEEQIKQLLKKLRLYDKYYSAVSRAFTSDSLTNQIIDFIMDNVTEEFWEHEHIQKKSIRDSKIISMQHDKEILKYVPDYYKETWEKSIIARNKNIEEIPVRRRRRTFRRSDREALLNYYRQNTANVIRNTFGARSQLFHLGVNFPKYSISGRYNDWLPKIEFEDQMEFMSNHWNHKYEIIEKENGTIIRRCSCGETKEIPIILSLYGFERMIHHSLFNYIMNTSKRN